MEEQKERGVLFISKEIDCKIKDGYCINEGILKTQEESWTYKEINSIDQSFETESDEQQE